MPIGDGVAQNLDFVGQRGTRVLLLHATHEAESHWMTRRLLRRAGLSREQFVENNLENLRALGDERAELSLLVKRAKVGVIVPLGEDPLYSLLGTSELLRWFHRAVEHKELGVWVVPNFAPHKLLPYRSEDADEWDEEEVGTGKRRRKAKGMRHPPRFTGVVAATLHKALRIARIGLPEAPKPLYQCDPPPSAYALWVEEYERELASDPELILSHDCETAWHLDWSGDEDADLGIDRDKRIIRSSFAFRSSSGVIYAISVPHAGPYVALTRRLLQSPGPKLGWYSWVFDEPVWELNGETINGRHYDGLDAWHLLQSDLDNGVEFVSAFYTRLLPWKHTAQSTPDLYAAIDAYAALENFLGIRDDLKAAGQWDLYERHAVDLHPILRRASKRGVMIDVKLREELRQEFRVTLRKLLLEAQGMVPRERQRFKAYVRMPKVVTGTWEQIEVTAKRRICLACQRPNVNRRHACKVDPEGWKIDYTKMLGHVDEQQVRHINTAPTEGCTLEELEKWLKFNGFNPNSSKQLIAYMKAYRHPVGYNHKTEEESADNKHLKALVKKYGRQHPIYAHTVEIHLVQKALSQYIEGIVPDAEGLVHNTYVNGPSTWRLASRAPNLQNVSRRASNPHAARTRRMYIARPGHVFVQCDSTSIEAVLVGYFMGDDKFIQIAKQSVHGYVCSRALRWPFTPETVERIKSEQKALYDRKKTTVYLSLYGGSWYLMYMSEPEVYGSAAGAKREQNELFAILPGLPTWHHQTRIQAQKEAYLRDPWGGRHYFYDVFTYKLDEAGKVMVDPETGREKLKFGKDDKRAVSFRPQAGAGRFMRDTLLLVGQTEWAQYMPANVTTHDSLLLEVPEELRDQAARFELETMTRPIPELGGLRIGAECEWGRDWKEMTKIASWPMLDAVAEVA